MRGTGGEQRKSYEEETPHCMENCHLWCKCQPRGRCAQPSREEQVWPGRRAGGRRRDGPLFHCSSCPLALVPYPALQSCKGSSRSLTFTQQTRTAKARGTQERGTHSLDPVLRGGPCHRMGLPPEATMGCDIHSDQTSGVLGLSSFKFWENGQGKPEKGRHLFV